MTEPRKPIGYRGSGGQQQQGGGLSPAQIRGILDCRELRACDHPAVMQVAAQLMMRPEDSGLQELFSRQVEALGQRAALMADPLDANCPPAGTALTDEAGAVVGKMATEDWVILPFSRGPCNTVVAGPTGSGKSTLGEGIVAQFVAEPRFPCDRQGRTTRDRWHLQGNSARVGAPLASNLASALGCVGGGGVGAASPVDALCFARVAHVGRWKERLRPSTRTGLLEAGGGRDGDRRSSVLLAWAVRGWEWARQPRGRRR